MAGPFFNDLETGRPPLPSGEKPIDDACRRRGPWPAGTTSTEPRGAPSGVTA